MRSRLRRVTFACVSETRMLSAGTSNYAGNKSVSHSNEWRVNFMSCFVVPYDNDKPPARSSKHRCRIIAFITIVLGSVSVSLSHSVYRVLRFINNNPLLFYRLAPVYVRVGLVEARQFGQWNANRRKLVFLCGSAKLSSPFIWANL